MNKIFIRIFGSRLHRFFALVFLRPHWPNRAHYWAAREGKAQQKNVGAFLCSKKTIENGSGKVSCFPTMGQHLFYYRGVGRVDH